MSTEHKEQEPNPNVNDNDNLNSESKNEERRSSTTRTPFTNLNQVDADLALARTLQEQERAYMMLSMNNDGSDYGSWEAESYLHYDDFDDLHDDDDDDDDEGEDDGTDDDADVFHLHAQSENGDDDNNPSGELDPADFSSDEAYARALQDAEEREMTARVLALAGINGRETVTIETHGHGGNAQDTWEEVGPDELSYEELLALGEVVGSESKGLSVYSVTSLPSVTYKAGNSHTGSNDLCVICLVDYEEGDSLTVLSCKHSYHPECINNWLKINKVCPVCSAEVSI
ncbi:E3 ubiquitin ligase BIG BROTHER-related [Hibiscus syriacus]|uniref:E3 ubiquitin ligase BIG BROTHER-related n=1 Tax=Hibiscus syriacus TaxID=106335 RepID=A0A6A3AIG9_HIBSY|nr:E3 ubiquitin ligase BIG BROTHER-related [Hibiscus syriacus]